MADNNNKKGTIFQNLNQIFNWSGVAPDNNFKDENKAKIIIKGNSPEEIQRKGLELQQKRDLENKFFKTTERGFQKAMQYEAARIPAYTDFEGMEYYPIIASALDLFMEESTTVGDQGKMLSIYSQDERIKYNLEELFYNILNVNVNLPFWIRNFCKYGDNFILVYGERKEGITHVQQCVNNEIERLEKVHNGKPRIIFKQRMTGDEFNTFEVAHFRLLGSDQYLPYGVSVLSKCRRIWRQLCIFSESKVWTPEGYTLIKDLKINDIVFSYDFENKSIVHTKVKNIMNNGEKEVFKVKTRHRELILTDDHPLLTTNDEGKTFTYKNINQIHLKKDKLILPAIDGNVNEFKITMPSEKYYVKLNKNGKIRAKKINPIGILKRLSNLNCKSTVKNLHSFLHGYNRKINYNDYLIIMNEFNLNLDDVDIYHFKSINPSILNKNLEFTITGDFIKFFGFMLGDGWIKPKYAGFALGVCEEQNSYYINLVRELGIDEKTINRYDKIGTKSSKVEIPSIELSSIFTNLGFITDFANKIIPDWVFNLSLQNKFNFIRGIFDADGGDGDGRYSSSNYKLISGLRILAQSCNIKCGEITEDLRTTTKFNNKIVNRNISYRLYLSLKNFSDLNPIEFEKIISIENIGNKNVWDIEVDNDLHNFIAEGLVVHNCLAEDAMLTYRIIRAGEKKVFYWDVGNMDEDDIEAYIHRISQSFKKLPNTNPTDGQMDYRFNILGNDEDYHMPQRNGQNVSRIETLPGAQNLNDIADIQYLRDNLFTALSIPRPFISFQDAGGGGKNLAQFDMRFAKKINRIQQAAIQELNKIAMIHLYYLGYGKDDITNFSLLLNNPSTQQEMMKVELLEAKANAFKSLTDSSTNLQPMSRTTAIRMIFGFSDKEIIDDYKKMRMERAAMQELQDSPLVIKKTTIFDDIDKKYGNPEIPISGGTENMGGNEIPPIANLNAGGQGLGAENFQTPAELPPVAGEAKTKDKPILSEEDYNNLINALVNDGTSRNPSPVSKSENKKLLGEADMKVRKLNFEASSMVNEIDNLLEISGKITKIKTDFQDIENIELVENLENELKDMENNEANDNKVINENIKTKKTRKKK